MRDAAPKLYVVDASSYVYRAFHAVPPLTSRTGLPTNATYGFTNMLLKLLREERPDRIAIVFDAGGPTFRDEAYAEYKAHREATPDDLLTQLPWICQVVESLRLCMLEVSGVEADDVIATLVASFGAQCSEVVIVTGDKDFMQLVSPKVILYDTMKERRFDEAEVRKKFGVGPDKVVDVLALMGDSIDNVPGVKGIGEKTAQVLISELGTLEELYARLPDIEKLALRGAKSVRQKLENGAEAARLSKELVTLRRDVPLELSLEDLRVGAPDVTRLRALFTDLGFQSLAAELAPAEGRRTGTTGWVEDRDALGPLATAMAALPRISVEPVLGDAGHLEAVAFGIGADEACVVRCGTDGRPTLDDLRPLLESATPPKVSGDVKQTLLRLSRVGIRAAGFDFDVGVASYVVNPARQSHRVEDVALEVLGAPPALLADDPGESAAERARLDLRLENELASRMTEQGAEPLFREIEMPLVGVLGRMEERGVRIDVEHLRTLGVDLERRMNDFLAEIYALAGGEFNVNSPPQLREVLFDRLKISTKGVRKGKTGLSTDVDVLTKLAKEHPLPDRIIGYRALSKLKSTYVDSLPALVDPRDGRLHTSFNQTVAATGRLSSAEPNLQNIPVRTEEGRRIRAAFVPEAGARLVSADYSQIELRVLAHISGDERLRESFREGEDVHVRTAAEVFHVEPAAVSADQRRAAKVINFGIIYGMGPVRLAKELEISHEEAVRTIASYFERYAGVAAYVRRTIEEARRVGYVTTLFGRRRPIPDLASPEGGVRQFAERVAVNTPIQGTAADLIKKAMVAIDRRLTEAGGRAGMILQVHDELIVETPAGEAEAVAAIVREEMESAAELAVPLVVEVGIGENWAEIH
jgi:DNA polymerase I